MDRGAHNDSEVRKLVLQMINGPKPVIVTLKCFFGLLGSVVQFHTAIFCPGLFIAAICRWLFFAVADNAQLIRLHAKANEVACNGVGATLTQRQVVFTSAAFIGVTTDLKLGLRLALQVLRVSIQTTVGQCCDVTQIGAEIKDANLQQIIQAVGAIGTFSARWLSFNNRAFDRIAEIG